MLPLEKCKVQKRVEATQTQEITTTHAQKNIQGRRLRPRDKILCRYGVVAIQRHFFTMRCCIIILHTYREREVPKGEIISYYCTMNLQDVHA